MGAVSLPVTSETENQAKKYAVHYELYTVVFSFLFFFPPIKLFSLWQFDYSLCNTFDKTLILQLNTCFIELIAHVQILLSSS